MLCTWWYEDMEGGRCCWYHMCENTWWCCTGSMDSKGRERDIRSYMYIYGGRKSKRSLHTGSSLLLPKIRYFGYNKLLYSLSLTWVISAWRTTCFILLATPIYIGFAIFGMLNFSQYSEKVAYALFHKLPRAEGQWFVNVWIWVRCVRVFVRYWVLAVHTAGWIWWWREVYACVWVRLWGDRNYSKLWLMVSLSAVYGLWQHYGFIVCAAKWRRHPRNIQWC